MVKDKSFGIMLKELREKKNVTLEQLGAGLCDSGKLSRIENGKAEAEKLLRDRLLDRLGVAAENYENFLYYSDYKVWRERQDIIHGILYGRLEEAKQLLGEYQKKYSMEQPLQYQFYLSMWVQIKKLENAEEDEIRELFEVALRLTVSQEAFFEPESMLLSIEELNLLLEYAFYNEDRFTLAWYEKMISCIEKLDFDYLAKAKIYPKLIVYYYQKWAVAESVNVSEISKLLRFCNRAIEILQKGNRMFYLWELLRIKETLLQWLIKENEGKGENAVKQLKEWKQTCVNWYTTLTEVYEEYDVTKETKDFCYIYVDREAHCIGDVIRIRRKMFGMTMAQLSDGICSERTVSRLERNETEPHREIVQLLFERLNMPGEFCRRDLVTGNPEVLRLLFEAKILCEKREFNRMNSLLEQIKSKVSYEIPGNMQVIRRMELVGEWNKERTNNKHEIRYFVEQLKETLGDTVPYEIAVAPGDKYLTENEILCLQNIMIRANQTYSEMEECMNALYDLYEKQRCIEECFNFYGVVMGNIASKFGNMGEYDRSDEIGLKILKYELQYRRIGRLYREAYSLLWNDVQRVKNQHPAKRDADTKKELLKCIYLCEISDNQYQLSFLKERLQKGTI